MQEKMQHISPIKQRILQFFETLNISKRDFYTRLGISRGTLESNTGITEDVMAKFIATFPDISIDWLIFGTGSMIKEAKDQPDGSIPLKEPAAVYNKAQQTKGIPLIPIHAEAGAFTCDISIHSNDCEYYDVPAFKGADFLITVRGDSMLPTYRPGDIVACKKVDIKQFLQWNRVHVIDTDQGPVIKRIRQTNDADMLLIVSDNPDYASFTLSTGCIHNIALVLGSIRPE